MNDAAAQALLDDEYRRKMVAYGREVGALLDPIWKREVTGRE
jgi:hypothetical protein